MEVFSFGLPPSGRQEVGVVYYRATGEWKPFNALISSATRRAACAECLKPLIPNASSFRFLRRRHLQTDLSAATLLQCAAISAKLTLIQTRSFNALMAGIHTRDDQT